MYIQDEAHRLVVWYEENKRSMPWRTTTNPYAIWVSETMLQQTRVETVIPYYHAFLASFPTVLDLAAADEQWVLKHWQGLGYYSRARNLHKAAKQVVSKHLGNIPNDAEQFRALPGVGPYTVGAVMSIAFNQPVPAVDGNVMRVITRYLGIDTPMETQAAKQQVTEQVGKWLHLQEPRVVTQALMELGATVCSPKSPGCGNCPLQEACVGRESGHPERYPVRKPKPARRKVLVVALWWEENGGLWIQQRPENGLLANLWQLPAWEYPEALDGNVSEQAVEQFLDAQVYSKLVRLHDGQPGDDSFYRSYVEVARATHIYTHLEWEVRVYQPVPAPDGVTLSSSEGRQWVSAEELQQYPWPRVYEKVLEQLKPQAQSYAVPLL